MDSLGIEMSGVSVVFDTPARTVTAVTGIDQSIPHSSFVSIVGPSGCGKSTLLRAVADEVQHGVDVRGRPVGPRHGARRCVPAPHRHRVRGHRHPRSVLARHGESVHATCTS